MSTKPSDLEKGAPSFDDIPLGEEEEICVEGEEVYVKEGDVEEQAPVVKQNGINERNCSLLQHIGLLLLILFAGSVFLGLYFGLK